VSLFELSLHTNNLNVQVLSTFEVMFRRVHNFKFQLSKSFEFCISLLILDFQVIDLIHILFQNLLQCFDLLPGLFIAGLCFGNISKVSLSPWFHPLFGLPHLLFDAHVLVEDFLFQLVRLKHEVIVRRLLRFECNLSSL
jgi:hypothetical protein